MSHRDLIVADDDGNLTTNRAYYGTTTFTPPPIKGWDTPPAPPPPWADGSLPDMNLYTELELFVAGRLSTMAPFARYHPAWALPFARAALEACGDWEPSS